MSDQQRLREIRKRYNVLFLCPDNSICSVNPHPAGDYVFTSERGSPLGSRTVQLMLDRAAERAWPSRIAVACSGFPRVRPAAWRSVGYLERTYMDDNLETMELARKEGENSVVIWLRLCRDGAIRIEGQDMGPLVERTWNHDDYEYSVTVPAAAVPKLAFELLWDRFKGNLSADVELREFLS